LFAQAAAVLLYARRFPACEIGNEGIDVFKTLDDGGELTAKRLLELGKIQVGGTARPKAVLSRKPVSAQVHIANVHVFRF
jgi:hypothetical protein